MKFLFVVLVVLQLAALTFAQVADSPYVTITGTNANYAGGTITPTLVRPGKPNATGTKVVLTGTGTFSLVSWNNMNSHNEPSTTTFTLVTANGKTTWTTPAITISQSQDISQQLTLAPIPQN